jgi:hypothetical protein
MICDFLIVMHRIIFIILLTIFISLTNPKDLIIFAHNFDTDDNSSFLTLVNKLIIENRLLNNSITNSNNNNLNSFEYIENIENILEEILISEDSFIIDSDQFYNNTIIALVVANLADEVLRNYGHAFGVPSNIMLSMNFSNLANGLNNSSNAINMNMNAHSAHITHQKNTTSTMIDNSSYYNVLEISNRMIELYDSELKEFSSNSTYINKAKSDLSDALYDLKKDIEIKESPYKIMEDVHGRVHPNLQIAFNLTLRQ